MVNSHALLYTKVSWSVGRVHQTTPFQFKRYINHTASIFKRSEVILINARASKTREIDYICTLKRARHVLSSGFPSWSIVLIVLLDFKWLSHFARELMTINRQNGIFSHSRFILLGFLTIRLMFFKTCRIDWIMIYYKCQSTLLHASKLIINLSHPTNTTLLSLYFFNWMSTT
jgi:hypothetical protein